MTVQHHHLVVFICCIFSIYLSVASEYRLSDSKLLLPFYNRNAINYTIRGSEGTCYEWYSGTPEVASVNPLAGDKKECSNAAVITAVWQSQHRAAATLYAQVSATGHVVKCDVIVDNIHEIRIETTTQELYLHNTPEALVVSAYDEYGNRFSTLEGVPFEWRIHGDMSPEAGDGHRVLRFLKWTESEYETTTSISNLESKGIQSYMQLVGGLRTGSAVVSASLSESVYANVDSTQVRLLVMANAQLSPPLTYLLLNAQITFRVHIIQHGNDQEIGMPSRQYHLLVNDTAMLSLEDDGCTVTAKRHGQTQITLLDRNVEEALENLRTNITSATGTNESNGIASESLRLQRRRLPTSLIHVVEAAYLGFSLVSSTQPICQRAANTAKMSAGSQSSILSDAVIRNWVMEIGKDYSISIDVFDPSSRRIYPSDNLRLNLVFPPERFEVIATLENKTRITLRPILAGPATLSAKLAHVLDKTGRLVSIDTPISGSQDIDVQPPIHIVPSTKIVLPWPTRKANTTEPVGGYQLQATGGSGRYTWVALSAENTGDQLPISVTLDGKLSALELGEALIIASNSATPQLCTTAQVVVTPPVKLHFVSGPSEVIVNSEQSSSSGSAQNVLIVGLAMVDANGNSMAECSQSDVTIQPMDSTVISVLPGWLPPQNVGDKVNVKPDECLRVRVIGLKVGHTELEATYNITDADGIVTRSLSTRFLVAVYANITVTNPSSSITWVAVGSTRQFIFTGGPQPWPLEPSGHFIRVIPTTDDRSKDMLPTVVQLPHRLRISSFNDGRHAFSFSVQCLQRGSFVLQLDIGNQPSATNPTPITMHSVLTVVCDLPATLRLIPRIPLPKLPSGSPQCPFSNSSSSDATDSEMSAPNTVPFPVQLFFANSKGRELEAVDSLETSVFLQVMAEQGAKPIDLVVDPRPVVQHADLLASASTGANNRPYFLITPRQLDKGGVLVLHVETKSNHHLFSSADSRLILSVTRNLQLSPPARLLSDSSHFRILLHPESDLLIHTVGGSGHYHYHIEGVSSYDDAGTSVPPPLRISRSFHEEGERVAGKTIATVYRVQPQHISQSRLVVWDLCFPAPPGKQQQEEEDQSLPPVSLQTTVDVVGLAELHLDVTERIQLGKQALAVVVAIGTDGQLLSSRMTRLLDLTVLSGDWSDDRSLSPTDRHILELPHGGRPSREHWLSSEITTANIGRAQFMLRALTLGSAGVSVSTYNGDPSIGAPLVSSNRVEIHVFAPLSLYPCNFNLLIGAEYELQTSGGPEPADFEFSTPDPALDAARLEIVTVSNRNRRVLVRASGSSGVAKIFAKAVSLSSKGGNFSLGTLDTLQPLTPVFSEITCSIHVVALSAVRIGCPLAIATELSSLPRTSSELVLTTSPTSEDARVLIACTSTLNCGAAPLWLEGLASRTDLNASNFPLSDALVLSPMTMAGLLPSLRFSWRLSPKPDSDKVARLSHILTGLNVNPQEEHLTSGMLLKALSPGRVTVHLTVESTDASARQLTTSSSSSRVILQAQLTVIVLPQLILTWPQLEPRQLILSPGSRFQLSVGSDVLANSHVRYNLVHIAVTEMENVTWCTAAHVTVSSTGLITVPTSTDKQTKHLDQACYSSMVEVTSWPRKDHPDHTIVPTGMKQSIFIPLILDYPRYILATPVPHRSQYLPASGLLVGGPYELTLTFHDYVGHQFDAVSDEYLQLSPSLHRNDLFDIQLIRKTLPTSDREIPTLLLHTRPKHTLNGLADQAKLDTSSSQTVFQLKPTISSSSLVTPFYITLPYAGEIDFGNDHSLVRYLLSSQWACLPTFKGHASGRWSSSDPSLLWVDSQNGVLMGWRPGQAYLMYTPSKQSGADVEPSSSDNAQLSYLISISVLPMDKLHSSGLSVGFLPISSDTAEVIKFPTYLPLAIIDAIGSSVTPSIDYLVEIAKSLSSVYQSQRSDCQHVDDMSLRRIAALAPIQCTLRISSPRQDSGVHHFSPLPNWLSKLLTWHLNDTGLSEYETSSYSASSQVLLNFISTQLEAVRPNIVTVPQDGQLAGWKCSLRVNPTVSSMSDLLKAGLSLQPGTRLQLELIQLTDTGDSSGRSLASTEVVPLPGFQMVVPPPVLQTIDNSYHFSVTKTTDSIQRRFLVFVPPSTAAELFLARSDRHHLVAHSRSPNLLEVSQAIRPITSIEEAIQILREYDDHLSRTAEGKSDLLGHDVVLRSLWQAMANEQIQMAENEIALFRGLRSGDQQSVTSLVQHKLLWVVELQAVVSQTDVKSTVVEVVISLGPTGQHTVVRVHLDVASLGRLKSTQDGDGYGGSVPGAGFTWAHLIALIFITLLVAAVINVLVRSVSLVSVSTGFVVKSDHDNLPSPIARPGGSPRPLWSQGYNFLTAQSHSPLQQPSYMLNNRAVANEMLPSSPSGDIGSLVYPTHRQLHSPTQLWRDSI